VPYGSSGTVDADGTFDVGSISGRADAMRTELTLVAPRKRDAVRIVSGAEAGETGQLLEFDGHDAIVKLNGSLDIKILDMACLGRVVGSE
jgi:hypothetical protein